jgi:hypothetical protein
MRIGPGDFSRLFGEFGDPRNTSTYMSAVRIGGIQVIK